VVVAGSVLGVAEVLDVRAFLVGIGTE
jgi:hypothetical protein